MRCAALLWALLAAPGMAYPEATRRSNELTPVPYPSRKAAAKAAAVSFASSMKQESSTTSPESAATGSACNACEGLECPSGWDTAISLEKGCSCICVPASSSAHSGSEAAAGASSNEHSASDAGAGASSENGGAGSSASDTGSSSGGASGGTSGSSSSGAGAGASKAENKPFDDKILADPGWESNENNCTFVAHLHIRKCGGTSVRKLFEGLAQYGWKQNLGYCASMAEHVNSVPDNPSGKNWMEVHCAENIALFNDGVDKLRAKVEPKGCKVVTSLLVRNAADQAVSEWLYFYKDQQHLDNPAWAKDLMDFALSHPDEMLRLLTMNHRAHPKTAAIWEGTTDDKSLPALASCDAAVDLMRNETAKIDLVGTMDTPEDFTGYWAALGHLAGFPVYEGSRFTFNQHVKDHNPDGRASADPTVTDSDMKKIAEVNGCSQRIADAVGKHLSQVQQKAMNAAASMAFGSVVGESTGQRLLRLWGKENILATLGHEPEPHSQEILAAERAAMHAVVN